MRVIAKKVLVQFWKRHNEVVTPLEGWYHEALLAEWRTPAEIKRRYPSASILKNNRVVFNISGNKYRLVVVVLYNSQILYIRFVGTHAEYDNIDAEVI